ncbi:MAG: hypothetical protein H0Z35_10370 [Thermoanaerobacteraceae bacterium]|nr:hypothetical protein [Thermoanaerobacteraceae bacterium]
MSWRTAAKYAKKENWNKSTENPKRRKPVMGPYAHIADMWLMEDMLKPRKERRTAAAIYRQLKEEYGYPDNTYDLPTPVMAVFLLLKMYFSPVLGFLIIRASYALFGMCNKHLS